MRFVDRAAIWAAPLVMSLVAASPVVAATPSAVAAAPPGLVSGVPAIEGYSLGEVPAGDELWRFYGVAPQLTLTHALVLTADRLPVARLIVASSSGGRRAIDAFVEHAFSWPTHLPLDVVTPVTDRSVLVMNVAHPEWTEMEGHAVMRAEHEIDGNIQWAWSAHDAVWIVRGTTFAEDYVRALMRAHAPSIEFDDGQGLLGDLWVHKPSVPGYRYADLPRILTLASMAGREFPAVCSERFYTGLPLRESATGATAGPGDLWLTLEKAGGRCVADGLLDYFAADLAAAQRVDRIGGLIVYSDEHSVAVLLGDVLVKLHSTNAQTMIDMAPFIEQFLAAQPPRDVVVDRPVRS